MTDTPRPRTANEIRELARLNHSGTHSCTGACLAEVVAAFEAEATVGADSHPFDCAGQDHVAQLHAMLAVEAVNAYRGAGADSGSLRAALESVIAAWDEFILVVPGVKTGVVDGAIDNARAALAASSVPTAPPLDVMREVAASGVVHEAEPPGIDYVTVQIDMDTWATLQEWFARLTGPTPEEHDA